VNRLSAVVLTGFAAIFAIGCGGGKDLGIKEGDKLVLSERLERQRFDASYGENVKAVDHTEGGNIEIPEGTVFEVFVTPRKEAKTIEVRIVKATVKVADESGAVTDREIEGVDELTPYFVPERYRYNNTGKSEDEFLYYTLSVPVEFLGTKLKKL